MSSLKELANEEFRQFSVNNLDDILDLIDKVQISGRWIYLILPGQRLPSLEIFYAKEGKSAMQSEGQDIKILLTHNIPKYVLEYMTTTWWERKTQ